ncbi:MAG: hypothetical protein JXB88_01405 [Spirochaetales bacterium]|nr:hypothetical protein [Spirochaetales bacterium]
MSDRKETGNIFTKNVAAFLLDKPIWVWWIFYVAVTVALFGIFYLAFYLLSIQWWVGVVILFATGMIWGSIKYLRIKGKTPVEKKEDEKSV